MFGTRVRGHQGFELHVEAVTCQVLCDFCSGKFILLFARCDRDPSIAPARLSTGMASAMARAALRLPSQHTITRRA